MNSPSTLEPRPDPRPTEALPALNEPGLYPELDLDHHGSSKSHWWIWVLVFGLVGFGCYKLYQFENAKKAAIAGKKAAFGPRAIPIVAAKARTGDLPVYLQGLGTVTAFNTVNVKTRVDGQMLTVHFHEGQNVKKGELLATLDPRPFQVALDQAKGQMAQAKGNLAKDQASLGDAQVNYVRYQELFKDNIIAKQQLDTQLATVNQIKGQIEADNAAIEAADAQVGSANLNLSYTNVLAPLSGKIGLRLVDPGNMVHAADPNGIAVITQLQPIAVLFSIPEDQLPSVLKRLSEGAKLKAEAWDRDLTKKLADGLLVTVDNQIDTTTGTSRLKAVFSNEDGVLFPNQFVNIKLWLNTMKNAVIVPAAAIQRGPTGAFVYLVQEDNHVTVRPVKVGLAEGDDITIADGLAEGDRVVTDGAEKLNEGMQVSIRQPGDNSAPGGPGGHGGHGGKGAGKGKRGPAE